MHRWRVEHVKLLISWLSACGGECSTERHHVRMQCAIVSFVVLAKKKP